MTKKTNKKKFPPKVIIRNGESIEFKKTNSDFPNSLTHFYKNRKGYQELYPSVYSIDIPGEGFFPLYNFFPDIYLENIGFINYDQFSLYNYIGTLRNRGYYLSIRGNRKKDTEVKGLAQVIGVAPPTITAHLDHLEDCLLIHRVRRRDLQGMPNELVIHSPFTEKQLMANDKFLQKLIVKRISTQHTKTTRQKHIRKSNGKNGGFAYLDRSTERRFEMDYNFISNSFEDHSGRFADFALSYFKKNLDLLKKNIADFNKYFNFELEKNLTHWGIINGKARNNCYIAAHNFRKIYCPTLNELCGTG